MGPGVDLLFFYRPGVTFRAAFSGNGFAKRLFDRFYRCREPGAISLFECRLRQFSGPDDLDIKQEFEADFGGLRMINDFYEDFFPGVKGLVGLKIKSGIAEIIYLTGRSCLLGKNIMGYYRFILIALMFPSLNVCAQIFPLSPPTVNWRINCRFQVRQSNTQKKLATGCHPTAWTTHP